MKPSCRRPIQALILAFTFSLLAAVSARAQESFSHDIALLIHYSTDSGALDGNANDPPFWAALARLLALAADQMSAGFRDSSSQLQLLIPVAIERAQNGTAAAPDKAPQTVFTPGEILTSWQNSTNQQRVESIVFAPPKAADPEPVHVAYEISRLVKDLMDTITHYSLIHENGYQRLTSLWNLRKPLERFNYPEEVKAVISGTSKMERELRGYAQQLRALANAVFAKYPNHSLCRIFRSP